MLRRTPCGIIHTYHVSKLPHYLTTRETTHPLLKRISRPVLFQPRGGGEGTDPEDGRKRAITVELHTVFFFPSFGLQSLTQ